MSIRALLVILVIAAVCLLQARLATSDPVHKRRLVRSVSPAPRNPSCEAGKRIGCADCGSVQICRWDGTPVESSKYRCDSVDRTKPFCEGNTGVCSDTPSADCIKPSDLCPAPGIFPQPTNCREYIICDNDKNAYVAACAPNEVYSHSVQDCVRSSAANTCFQLNCAAAASQNQWYAYTPNATLYVFCSSEAGPMTFKCSGEHSAFNVNLKRCDFRCPSPGRFAIPDEPAGSQRYYQCVAGAGNSLSYTVQTCPANLVFDVENSRCAPPPPSPPPGAGGDEK
ncbi:uncharacterized protein LOC129725021 [Wyeomyia smithii]|uniref:uncharacterized protein LOC129725021 n=1 Tax=Wyeomyia smithii TaxID=174621 RepID=UPI0024682168|nr:uncharacterized protein LOC129725021 [Wyeomyia smithii]